MGQELWRQYGGSSKMKNTFATLSSNSTLGVYPKELKIGFKDIFVHLCSLAALFTIAESWKQPRCPSMKEWINTMDKYSGILFSIKQIENSFFQIYFLKFIFNWRMIALHYCVAFCHTSTWISHRYTYVPSVSLPPTPSHSSVVTEYRVWAPCIIQRIPTGCLFYIC